MTIIKLNLQGSKYASHLDLSFKIQFEDAQSTERAICVPPIHNYWRYSTSHPKEHYVLCKHITADRRLKVFGTQKNKLKLINKSSLGLKTAWKAISISDITKEKCMFFHLQISSGVKMYTMWKWMWDINSMWLLYRFCLRVE